MKKSSFEEILNKEGKLIYSFVGCSMQPLLNEGTDQIFLSKTDSYELYDVVLFKASKKHYILHRIIGINDDTYAIIGDNSFHIDHKKKDELLAKMVGYYHNGEYKDINSDEYKEYLEKYIISEDNNYELLLKDSEQYFYERQKEAYYELTRLCVDPTYQIDTNKINKLKPSEKANLCNLLMNKKAGHILGYAINKFNLEFNDVIKKHAKQIYEVSKIRQIRIDAAKEAISTALDKVAVPHVFMKGSVVRDLYKNPYFRWSNDIDLYVDEKDIEKARNAFMNELNCTYFSECEHHLVFENEEFKLHFELHHILNNSFPKDLEYLFENPFADSKQDEKHSYLYHMDESKFYLFHLAHLIKHIATGDFWMPMVCDTHILNCIYKVNDSLLKDARLEKFNEEFKKICDSIFDDSVVLDDNEKSFEKILFKNSLEITGSVEKGAKKNGFTYVMSILFPKFKAMKFVYPVLKKAPVLLPLCYILRIITRVFNPKKFRMGVDRISAFNNAKKDEINIFNNVGLGEYILLKSNKD